MLRFRLLFVPLFVLATLIWAPSTASAQPIAERALVARIYEDLARGAVSPVVAVLDDQVLWIEGAHSRQFGRHIGAGTVARRVLQPQVASGIADSPDSITIDLHRVVAVGTTRRIDPSTGRLIVARFRHVWRVIDQRVVSVHRSDDGPDREDIDHCSLATC